MVKEGITIIGLPALRRKLDPKKLQASVKTGLRAGAVHVKGKIAVYPPSPSGRKQPFKTAKSRRYVFAALARGEIEIPYRRGQSPGSKSLGRKWQTSTRRWNEAHITNIVSYGEIVQARDKQSAFHKTTGWQTIEDVVDKEGDDVARKVIRSIAIWLDS